MKIQLWGLATMDVWGQENLHEWQSHGRWLHTEGVSCTTFTEGTVEKETKGKKLSQTQPSHHLTQIMNN